MQKAHYDRAQERKNETDGEKLNFANHGSLLALGPKKCASLLPHS